MKFINVDKKSWASGLENLYGNYRLFGPVRNNNNHHFFKELAKGELPDFNYLNTRLSPKSIVYPQSETMFEYSLDETKENHHILKEIEKDYSPRALIGIRPCDAASYLLVKRNFDTPEYKDPYWLRSYESTIFAGLACGNPCSTCFCTSAGCGPFHEHGLDLLLVDEGENFIAKILTSRGEELIRSAGWETTADSTAAEKIIKDMRIKAEEKITSFVSTDQLKNKSTINYMMHPFGTI